MSVLSFLVVPTYCSCKCSVGQVIGISFLEYQKAVDGSEGAELAFWRGVGSLLICQSSGEHPLARRALHVVFERLTAETHGATNLRALDFSCLDQPPESGVTQPNKALGLFVS
jgi:hypothetical protein